MIRLRFVQEYRGRRIVTNGKMYGVLGELVTGCRSLTVAGARAAIDSETVVRDYLPEALKTTYLEGMTRWVAAEAPAGPRRLWVELEVAPGGWEDPAMPMALDAHLADGVGGTRRLTLARCSYLWWRGTRSLGSGARKGERQA